LDNFEQILSMNYFLSRSIFIKALSIAVVVLAIKKGVIDFLYYHGIHCTELIELSDITIVFTGAFFVFGLLLAATMTDFKESEKIPGEVAANIEAIKDWVYLAFKAPRTKGLALSDEPLDKSMLRNELLRLTDGIIVWLYSNKKDSKEIFPLLRSGNEIAYYFAERGVDKEAIKGIQENTNVMRKQLTRAYSISRNNFIKPAYTLLKSILVIVFLLLISTKFKTVTADWFVTTAISFLLSYLYLLIVGLDDPFNISNGDTEVDLKPIDRLKQRIENEFLID
jgi:hypothetical protein